MTAKKKHPLVGTPVIMSIKTPFKHKVLNTTAKETPKSLLQRAHETINGQRQQDYGDKLQNFAQTAMIWQGILAPKLQETATITPEDVALLMIALKMSRLSKTPDHKDSILDIAGYAGCMDILQEDRDTGKKLLGATFDPRR